MVSMESIGSCNKTMRDSFFWCTKPIGLPFIMTTTHNINVLVVVVVRIDLQRL
jgi:hypothetical protein